MRIAALLTGVVLSLQLVASGSEMAEIQSVLKGRLGQGRGSAAVGIITKEDNYTFFHGSANGDSIFELGSVTKVFTALLLADMTVRKELELHDSVNELLGARASIREDIHLLHLATHTSGLPRSPTDFTMEYSEEQLYEFLSQYAFPREVGKKFKYSNVGFGLLGHTLALQQGTSYEQLILSRICRPLQMMDSRIRMSPEQSSRHADGHSATGQKIPTRELPATYWPAGALRSTLNDMLKFLKVNIAPDQGKLGKAILMTHKPRVPSIPHTWTGLAWNVTSTGVSSVIWHEGQIQSHYAFIGLVREQGIGAVVLASSGIPLTDVGLHILDRRYPLAGSEPPPQAKFKLDESSLESFAGQYRVRADYIITITREDDHLFSQATGMPKLEILPLSEAEFTVKGFNIKITFVKNKAGEVTSLIVYQAGTEVKAQKQPDDSKT